MFIHKVNAPVFIKRVLSHAEIKPKIISILNSGTRFSFGDSNVSISNTDYHLSPSFFEALGPKYWEVMAPEAHNHMQGVAEALFLNKWDISNYWFQEYQKGDRHSWHVHPGSMFTNVYYLSLPEGSMKTTLRVFGVETEFEVNEGDIMTIPSYIAHCSKPHCGDAPKIVVAFNSNVR